jgi:hypothetical protein
MSTPPVTRDEALDAAAVILANEWHEYWQQQRQEEARHDAA